MPCPNSLLSPTTWPRPLSVVPFLYVIEIDTQTHTHTRKLQNAIQTDKANQHGDSWGVQNKCKYETLQSNHHIFVLFRGISYLNPIVVNENGMESPWQSFLENRYPSKHACKQSEWEELGTFVTPLLVYEVLWKNVWKWITTYNSCIKLLTKRTLASIYYQVAQLLPYNKGN